MGSTMPLSCGMHVDPLASGHNVAGWCDLGAPSEEVIGPSSAACAVEARDEGR